MEFLELNFLTYTFMQRALIGGILGGSVLSFIGLFIVLRKGVFLGAALPQFAAFGIAAAGLAHLPPLVGALGGAIIGVSLLPLLGTRSRIPPDGVVGVGYASASALAIIFLALPGAHPGGAEHILAGDILGITAADIWIVSSISLLAALVHFIFWRNFKLVSYDREMATALGYNTRFWDGLLFLSLGIVLAAVMRITGSIVTFSYLVGPAAAGLLLSHRFKIIIPLVLIISSAGTFIGLWVSFVFDLPGGPTVAAVVLFPLLPAALVRYL